MKEIINNESLDKVSGGDIENADAIVAINVAGEVVTIGSSIPAQYAIVYFSLFNFKTPARRVEFENKKSCSFIEKMARAGAKFDVKVFYSDGSFKEASFTI